MICSFIFLFFLSFHSLSAANPARCLEKERSALLLFKQSFPNLHHTAYSTLQSWNHNNRDAGGDCCAWDGITCSRNSGYVTGLDLSYGALYGSIDSTSPLFHLVHLRHLNLAHNDFNHSQIPSGLGRLHRLVDLNLSYSEFSGHIPIQVSLLSELISLDLSGNPSIKLDPLGLKSLVQNLTYLQKLDLSDVRIYSTVPDTFAEDLSSVRFLSFKNCGLRGEFPQGVFNLKNLRFLSLSSNRNLTGSFPEFRQDSRLQAMILAGTDFSGEIPNSIGNLDSLNYLDISGCNFYGSIPPSLVNLTKLIHLDLNDNSFYSWTLPSWLGQLSQLSLLNLDATNLTGKIPSTLANLSNLNYFSLGLNELIGQIPPWLSNLTRLSTFNVYNNKLIGQIPDSVFELQMLQYLGLGSNRLHGSVELDKLRQLKNISAFDFGDNKFSVVINPIYNASFPMMTNIGLSSCNISEFPNFLRDQNDLYTLELDGNHIGGSIPDWFLHISTRKLMYLNLSSNFLTGFEVQPHFLHWKKLQYISIADNKLRGFLPIPSPLTIGYTAANNSFSGNLPLELCDLVSLYAFDVSNNNLSGAIPSCFGSFDNLLWLSLNGNNFNGSIPGMFKRGCQLHSIDLTQNQLQGELPRSLLNCTKLEYLGVGHNRINDTFPHWLRALPELKILILASNRFHGLIGKFGSIGSFAVLRIIDLSHNSFFGSIPPKLFNDFDVMKVPERNSTYMDVKFKVPDFVITFGLMYSAKMTIKGVETSYFRIRDAFKLIDLSGNCFNGQIPPSIVDLTALQSLNLSNNFFTGPIPPSLGNLTELESLDISSNSLSGQIPAQLTQLTFLGSFKASYNDLYGSIPRGRQFDTFDNISYLGNLGLCGVPLSRKCGSDHVLAPPISSDGDTDTDTESGIELDWVVISMGYACGLVSGVVIGCILIFRKHEWFEKAYECMHH